MKSVQALILGAGPSGLSLAYGLQGNTLVLEKESKVGGLCRSFEINGGIFDIGGHSLHTPHPEVDALVRRVLDGGLYIQQRDARVFAHGTLLPYPFQKFFEEIPDPEVVDECREGLLTAAGNLADAHDFEDHIIRKFGNGIARHFMLPYNRKLWARDLKRISCEWVSERVAGPKGEREQFDTSGGKRKPLQSETQVAYPDSGGFEEICKALVPYVPSIALDSEVTRIDPVNRVAVTRGGEAFQWEFLVSTIPLPILTRIVDGVPPQILTASRQLEYMSLRVELLLAGRQLETPIQRIYIADPAVPPHKIAFNHNSSAALKGRDCHAIMAEVSWSPEKPVDFESIAPKTIQFLCDIGLLASPKDIVWRGHMDVEYAYPVYTHLRPALLQEIKNWMAQYHIYTLGRFGDWEYINSDECIMQGMARGQELRQKYPAESFRG